MQNLTDLFNFIPQLHFTRIGLLLLLFLLPIIWLISKQISQHNLWAKWIKEPMLSLLATSNTKRSYTPLLLSVFFGIGIVALSGPSLQKKSVDVHKSSVPYFIVLDLSLSMLARDEKPNRLSLARFKLIDILKQNPDSLVSLIVYSGSAHVVIPLTEDHQTIISQLPALNPEIMPVPGSNPTLAMNLITQSVASLKSKGGIVLWLTDEASTNQIQQAATISKKNGLDLKLLLLGTEKGAPITLRDGRPFMKTVGQPVIAQAPILLMQAAANTNQINSYLARHLNPKTITHLAIPPSLNDTQRKTTKHRQWDELGYWLIPILMLLLMPLLTRNATLCLLVFLLANQPMTVEASWINLWKNQEQQGRDLFKKKQYQAATNTFLNPEWRTASQYRSEKYKLAAQNYARLGQHYNAGNAYAHAGNIKQAITHYKQAIAQNPNHKDAKHNLKLIQKIAQQQKQQQKQQGEKQQNKQSEQQKQQAQNTSSDQQQDQKSEQQADSKPIEQKDNQSSNSLDNDDRYLQEKDTDVPDSKEQELTENQENSDTEKEQQLSDAQADRLTKEQIAELERSMQYRQWLRTLENNPSLLLQRKFKRQYNQQGKNQDPLPEKIW